MGVGNNFFFKFLHFKNIFFKLWNKLKVTLKKKKKKRAKSTEE